MGQIRRDYHLFRSAHGRWVYTRAMAFDEGDLVHLTRRELEIFFLLGAGASNSDLMRLLCLSEPTVKGHISQITAKLHVTRAEAVACSARMQHEFENVGATHPT